jgi:hypothetical protein
LNRRERRAAEAQKRKPVVFEEKLVPTESLKRGMCAWRGCTAVFGQGDLPPGWIWLIAYWAPQVVTDFVHAPPGYDDWHRDGVLCPAHAHALDDLLKPLPRAINNTAGNA